jgi:rhamnose transport system permease protein
MAGLAAILTGVFSHNLGIPMPVTIVLVLLVGALCGAFNGAIITYFRAPPLIATLATLALYRGLAEGISKGSQVRNYPDWFLAIGNGNLLGIPAQVWILVGATIIAACLLGLTTFGRTTYAIGSNETAAKFSGLAVDRTKILIYAGSGFCAALSGILLVSRVTTTRSDMGSSWELQAITAVVLGGTSIFGGRGTIIGTILGLILVQILQNGLLLAGMGALRGWISGGDSTVVVVGAALILTVLVSNIFGGRREA